MISSLDGILGFLGLLESGHLAFVIGCFIVPAEASQDMSPLSPSLDERRIGPDDHRQVGQRAVVISHDCVEPATVEAGQKG